MARLILLLILGVVSSASQAQRLVEWTEGAGELGLGYPVPIPVDTSAPFDGFRTYDGLHARHQDLMLNLDAIEGSVVGTTTAGRDIWAYRLGDPDALTPTGLVESAVMIQGGIHSREWQTPETVTGLMEWVAERHDDAYIHQYLLEHMNIVVIPVLNIDGFLQTQRYPRSNYLGSDPNDPQFAPRDGRMRRKNMRGVDEDLSSVADHLSGVDLNRNNPPFWATSNRSSSDSRSLVYHGAAPHSEPETQAMVAAIDLGPGNRLRVYTDVHSFSQVHFSVGTSNERRNQIQNRLLADFSNHHFELPGAKSYRNLPSTPGFGIGSTDDYFATTFQIPSWTLEIEPSDGTLFNLPGEGADYGGLNSNGHDGFILPESEIRRVRENLAQSFVVAYYHQAGPPSVAALRFTDPTTGAVVFDAEWDVVADDSRALHADTLQPIELGRSYRAWIAFDKPMRWRENGEVTTLPGQFGNALSARVEVGETRVSLETEPVWLDQSGGAPGGYLRYRDDAVELDVMLDPSELGIGADEVDAVFELETHDMVGQRLDADPSTAVDWGSGHWVGYEDVDGLETDSGGPDRTLRIPITAQEQPPAFLIEPGNTAAYFDLEHAGEGFLLEVLDDARLVIYWFTYDEAGAQRWFIGTGEVRGNEAVFEDLLVASGGRFGSAFDPEDVELEDVGRLSLLFSGCDRASMRFATPGKIYRQDLVRLTSLSGLECGGMVSKAQPHLTGSWYDPDHAGEGFVVQALDDSRALIYWFSYDTEGRQAWFFGDAPIGEDLSVDIEALRPVGGEFGDDFDPATVELEPWGSMRFAFDCESASVEYSGPGVFGSGSQSLIRLTQPAGLAACADGG